MVNRINTRIHECKNVNLYKIFYSNNAILQMQNLKYLFLYVVTISMNYLLSYLDKYF